MERQMRVYIILALSCYRCNEFHVSHLSQPYKLSFGSSYSIPIAGAIWNSSEIPLRTIHFLIKLCPVPFLITWFISNPSMNKHSHAQYDVEWDCLSIRKLQSYKSWSLWMDKQVHPALLHCVCYNVSMHVDEAPDCMVCSLLPILHGNMG